MLLAAITACMLDRAVENYSIALDNGDLTAARDVLKADGFLTPKPKRRRRRR
jgi:hypothetical protein